VERVGVVLRDLGKGSAVTKRLAEAEALTRWADVVGSQLASRTVPVTVSGGRLLVVVRGSALRQELSFQKTTILRRFNAIAGKRVAREMVFLEGDVERTREQLEAGDWEKVPGVWGEREEGAAGVEGDDAVEEESGADDGAAPECGLAHQPLDAVAYRRTLERIAGGENAGEADEGD
jgi:hypothetical protein